MPPSSPALSEARGAAGLARQRASGDLRACRALLRKGSKSFFAASLLLPPRVRVPTSGLYAFCRVADDAVDEAEELSGKRRALERMGERARLAYEGRPEDHPVDRAFSAVVLEHGIPPGLVFALLEGFAWDAEGRRYESLSELRAYAARVASSVGVMMTWLMGPRKPEVLARACDLGVAMQLTNIARDVGEDARQGRLYLPLAWLEEAGIDPARLLASPEDAAHAARLAGVVERLLREADVLYARADAGVAMLPRDCRAAIGAARLIYSEIGRRLEKAGFDAVGQRAVVPTFRKLALVLRAWRAARASAPVPRASEVEPLEEVRFLIAAAGRRTS